MACTRPILQASDLNSPSIHEVGNSLNPLDFFEYLFLAELSAFMGPCVLDHVVSVVALDMPAQCSPAVE